MPQEKLWDVDLSYEESKKLLEETAAAVELIKYGAGGMEFAGLDTIMVSLLRFWKMLKLYLKRHTR